MKKDRVKIASEGINNSVSILKARLFSEPNVAMDNNLRLLEALLFAAVEPIDTQTLRDRLHSDVDVGVLLDLCPNFHNIWSNNDQTFVSYFLVNSSLLDFICFSYTWN